MSTGRSLIRIIRRRPHVCGDCESWLASTDAPRQRRTITRNHIRRIRTAEEEWKERKEDIKTGSAKSILEVLEERGLVNQIVGEREKLNDLLIKRRVGVYCGVDPTADSMHIGHMVPFMALGWMYIYGYTANFLLGGFTAAIGDPTDRLEARQSVAIMERKRRTFLMHEQLKRLGVLIEKYADRRGYIRQWAWRRSVLNNATWWTNLAANDFLKVMGTAVRIGPMLGRDTVKNRLEKGDGMSYAEFSYPLIQAWDWWHQFQTGTQIQIGGADQFGNILAGAEAVKNIAKSNAQYQARKKHEDDGQDVTSDPMGFTVPLLTTSSGEKFGKSAGNAVWLSREMMSSYDLYQHFLRLSDADVERYLRVLTFLPMEEISKIMTQHQQDESKRIAQHRLASEFVELVHGQVAAEEAESQHRQAFQKDMTLRDVKAQIGDMHPSLNKYAPPQDMDSNHQLSMKLPKSLVINRTLPQILWSAGMVASRSEGQRLINAKGVYIGGRKGEDEKNAQMSDTITYVPAEDAKWSFVEPLLIDNMLLLRTGKWKKKFIEIISDEEYEKLGLTCPGWKDDSNPADLNAEEQFRKRGAVEENQRQIVQERKDRKSQNPYGEITNLTFRTEPLGYSQRSKSIPSSPAEMARDNNFFSNTNVPREKVVRKKITLAGLSGNSSSSHKSALRSGLLKSGMVKSSALPMRRRTTMSFGRGGGSSGSGLGSKGESGEDGGSS